MLKYLGLTSDDIDIFCISRDAGMFLHLHGDYVRYCNGLGGTIRRGKRIRIPSYRVSVQWSFHSEIMEVPPVPDKDIERLPHPDGFSSLLARRLWRFASLYKFVRGKFRSSKSGTGSSSVGSGMPSQAYAGRHLMSEASDSHAGASQLNRGRHSVFGMEHSQGDDASGDPAWDAHIHPSSQASRLSYPYSFYGMISLDPFMGQPGSNWSETYDFGTVFYQPNPPVQQLPYPEAHDDDDDDEE